MHGAWINMNNMPKDGDETLLDQQELGKPIQNRLVMLFWELPLGGCQFSKRICASITMNMGRQGCASSGVGRVPVKVRFDPRDGEGDAADCNSIPQEQPQVLIGACASLRTDAVMREK